MDSHANLPDELITRLTCSRELILNGVITDVEPARATPLSEDVVRAIFHISQLLPWEIHLHIGELLVVRTLNRAARVIASCKMDIELIPAYQALLQHAPEALAALGRTRLAQYVETFALYMTLKTDRCAYCPLFGGFLFLPTRERVCFDCLRDNPLLLMTTPKAAKRWFGLSDEHLGQVPAMYSLKGTYGANRVLWRRRLWLVSAQQVKELAIRVHGSPDKLAEYMAAVPFHNAHPRTLRVFDIFKRMPVGADHAHWPRFALATEELDYFAGMAAIRFPSLRGGQADGGHICRGCQVSFTSQWRSPWIKTELMTRFVGPDVAGADMPRVLLAMKSRLRTRAEFVAHLRHCYGARLLFTDEVEELLEQMTPDGD